jgi:hypothetical protein
VLLLRELTEMFADAGIVSTQTTFYQQPMSLEPLMKGSFPNAGDQVTVRQIFLDDVGKDELGLGTHWQDGDVHFAYPIVALAGLKKLSIPPRADD